MGHKCVHGAPCKQMNWLTDWLIEWSVNTPIDTCSNGNSGNQSSRRSVNGDTLVMSKGRERKFEDMSHTSGTPFVSGTNGNSTPVPSPNTPKVKATIWNLYRHTSWRQNDKMIDDCRTASYVSPRVKRPIGCKFNKKAVLSQRWPRDARYISRSWAVAEIWPFEIIQDGGGRHLEFVRIENSAIRAADPEKPTL